MTGINIGLYRDKRRLTYSILDESNCAPGELFPITENTIKNKVIQYTSDPELLIHPPRTKKLQLSALPKTCRMVYVHYYVHTQPVINLYLDMQKLLSYCILGITSYFSRIMDSQTSKV
jgi:hypothetical protein